jgi:aspartate aminotransferase
MKSLSKRMDHVSEALTLRIAARAKELSKQGRKVFFFSIGEPDFPTPRAIKDKGIEAIETDFTKYTAGSGIPELRKAISADLTGRLGLPYAPEEIAVTIGGKFAIAAAVLASCDPGDEVVIPLPCFPSYFDQARLAQAIPVPVTPSEENGFRLTRSQLEAVCTPRTKMLLLNTPHNPTGVVYSREDLAPLAAFIKESGIYAVADEVYERLIFGGQRHASLASFPEIRDQVFLVNSFSKTYCMTGWRIGYCAAPKALSSAVAAVQSHMNSSANSIAQWAAVGALEGSQEPVDRMLAVFERRRDLMVELASTIPDITFPRPDGAFYLFINITRYLGGRARNSFEAAMYLLEEHGLAVMPGSAFGTEGFIRLSYAVSDEDIRNGMQELKSGLEALR